MGLGLGWSCLSAPGDELRGRWRHDASGWEVCHDGIPESQWAYVARDPGHPGKITVGAGCIRGFETVGEAMASVEGVLEGDLGTFAVGCEYGPRRVIAERDDPPPWLVYVLVEHGDPRAFRLVVGDDLDEREGRFDALLAGVRDDSELPRNTSAMLAYLETLAGEAEVLLVRHGDEVVELDGEHGLLQVWRRDGGWWFRFYEEASSDSWQVLFEALPDNEGVVENEVALIRLFAEAVGWTDWLRRLSGGEVRHG